MKLIYNEREEIIIIGSDGIPARYGGWETFVEHVSPLISENYSTTVVGSSVGRDKNYSKVNGVHIKYFPIKANGLWSILYDFISLIYCVIKRPEHVIMLGVSTALFLPILRPFIKKVYINVDGIEWRRDKWNSSARILLKICERISVKYANIIITDNLGIQKFIENEYHIKNTVMIPYGGDHSIKLNYCKFLSIKIDEIRASYLSVCRIEPENNIKLTLEAAKKTNIRLIFVGNWHSSEYGKDLYNKYHNISRITLLDPIYDLEILYTLRENCKGYIHGHSAGGTNPSLVEIMFHKKNIYAFDCVFNRETLNNLGIFYKDTNTLVDSLKLDLDNSNFAQDSYDLAKKIYKWQVIADAYVEIIKDNSGK